MGIYLPDARYAKPEQKAAFFRSLLDRLRALPGVESAGLAAIVPLTGNNAFISFDVLGKPVRPGDEPSAAYNSIDADYFRTMRTPLLRGRYFSVHDDDKSQPVAIISETFAKQYFRGESPVGKSIHVGTHGNRIRQIVGVVGDIRLDSLDDLKPRAAMYEPYLQTTWDTATFAIHSTVNPKTMLAEARQVVASLESSEPIDDPGTMQQLVSASLTHQRLALWLLAVFAGVAMALAAIGIYGVMAYLVSQRVPEIGVRMALGAGVRDILRMMLRHGMGLALTGIALGLAFSLGLTRLLKSQLYGITPTDPPTFLAVTLILALVVLAACLIPAQRAARVDPAIALRYE